jgi:hypothetical protein
MSDKQRRDSEPTFRNLRDAELDRNQDPVTKQPGSHPFGTAAGTATAGLAGALLGGVLAGPVGAAAGTIVAGVAGGLAGKAMAESIDPTVEDAYWRDQHPHQPYASSEESMNYETYAPAYRAAYTHYGAFEPGTQFEAAEPTLRVSYEAQGHPLGWDSARLAALAAWDRVNRAATANGSPAERERDLSGEKQQARQAHENEPVSTNPLSGDVHPHLHA